jgi:hypothetical protein
MTKGEFFLVNFDDTSEDFVFGFDPDFREFYNQSSLPQHLFNPKVLAIPEVQKRVTKDTQFEKSLLKDKVQVIFWSCFKVESDLDDSKIREKIDKRFSLAAPIGQMDVFVLQEVGDEIKF